MEYQKTVVWLVIKLKTVMYGNANIKFNGI